MLKMNVRILCAFLALLVNTIGASGAEGTFRSYTTGGEINFKVSEPHKPLTDYKGNVLTIVYLENLPFKKLGGYSNAQNVKWFLEEGYRVIELDYARHAKAVSPGINADIIALNDSLAAHAIFGLKDCSDYQSYILFEGYRILRNVPYFKDNPKVYNYPDGYVDGDWLNMDIVYPAKSAQKVPLVLSFSYSNSYATYDKERKQLTDAHKNYRLFLPYSLAGFNDSFLEGLPAVGMAWAIADHPKYCDWGKGKPENGKNDTYKSYQTNPDAAQKVKSAIRTVRAIGNKIGLSGKVGIYGFSRGSTAGSLAIGDRRVREFEEAGLNRAANDAVQAAALGPGVFDYTQLYNVLNDGDGNLETRCPWVWGPLEENYAHWERMGAAYLVQSKATAPVLFFYNTDDDRYYQDQIAHLKSRLEALGIPVDTLMNYGKGHAVPQAPQDLSKLYSFFQHYLK